MADIDYEKEYKEKKKKLRGLHKRLKDTKEVQEIYHKIMGTSDAPAEDESKSKKD